MTAPPSSAVRSGRRPFATPPPAVLALIVAASALAVAIVPFWVLDDADASPQSDAFVSTPQFVLWLLLLCAAAAIWVGAAAFVLPTVVRRARDLRQRRALGAGTLAALAASGLALGFLALAFAFGQRLDLFGEFELAHVPHGRQWPLEDHERKMPPLVGTGVLIGLVAIAGMWLVSVGFADLARHARPHAAHVRRFVTLRTELTALLAVAGALIGLATLTSGALREAVVAVSAEPVYRDPAVTCVERKLAGGGARTPEIAQTARADLGELLDTFPECRGVTFDRGYVVAYGLLFTGLLGIAFAPSFFAMREAGARLREVSYPIPSPRAATFADVLQKRAALDALLQTNLSGTTTFKAGVAIFTPLAASLLSTLLPS